LIVAIIFVTDLKKFEPKYTAKNEQKEKLKKKASAIKAILPVLTANP